MCQIRPPELVTLFTRHGVSVETKDVICQHCYDLVPEEKRVSLPSSDLAMVKPESARVPSGGVPGNHALELVSPVSPLPTAPPPRASPVVTDKAGSGHARNGVAPTPVSLGKQAWAVFMLRLQLQAKQKKTNCCHGTAMPPPPWVNPLLFPSLCTRLRACLPARARVCVYVASTVAMLLVSVVLIWASTPKVSVPQLEKCGNFYISKGLCSKTNYTLAQALAGDFANPNIWHPYCYSNGEEATESVSERESLYGWSFPPAVPLSWPTCTDLRNGYCYSCSTERYPDWYVWGRAV